MPRRAVRTALSAATVAALTVLTGCGISPGSRVKSEPAAARRPSAPPIPSPRATVVPSTEPVRADLLPLGSATLARVPATARQVVIVTGAGRNSATSTVGLYERSNGGWRVVDRWPAYNGVRGWTDDHHLGDLRSPIGVFTLTDAGGLLDNPGTALPYYHSRAFVIDGSFDGKPLAGSFDYVIAINYNRRTGVSPLDWTRPLGTYRGGGVWIHDENGAPTEGCISLSKAHMRQLLQALRPDQNPVIVMGDAASLSR